MDPINRLSRLMETLRQRMAESSKQLDASRPSAAPARNDARTAVQRRSVEQLRLHIGDRIRALDPNNAEHERQARRAFLESILAWEFGDDLLLDTQFTRLIDGIQSAFESDPEVNKELSSLLSELSRR